MLSRVRGLLSIDIPGMALWLRSDLGLFLANGSVSKWADQSGYGNDAVALTGVAPTFPGPLINGQSTLLCLHATTQCMQVNAAAVRPTTGITVMAVVQEVLADAFMSCQSDGTCTDGWGMKTTDGGINQADWYVGNITVVKVGTNTGVPGTNHLYIGTWDIVTGIMAFWNNGVLIGTNTFAGPISYSGNSPTLQINSQNQSTSNNAGRNASTNIAEIGMWPRALTAGELALLNNRVNTRYGLF